MSGTLRAYHKTPEDEDSRLGQVIDCYRLVRRIAMGGMGTVYEAVHVHLGRRYAMKVLNPQLQGNAQATARFIAEGQAANQPKGQGVVAVHNVGRAENGSIYILMEYLEGETLSARIASTFGERDAQPGEVASPLTPLPPDRDYLVRSLRLARQLASTLEVIHRSGVIHRDLKPDNVFVVQDPDAIGGERVKILDFGIAKVVAPADQRQNSPVTWAPTLQRTLLGTVLGTPTYMAPEQWRGDGQADDRTDSYGLGAIFFEMFAGRPPFTAKLIGDLMAQHCTEPAPPLDQVAPWAPAGLSELVNQMLAKDLRARPSMNAISQRIAASLACFVGESMHPAGRFRLAKLRRAGAKLRARVKRLWELREAVSAAEVGVASAGMRRITPRRMMAASLVLFAALIGVILLRWRPQKIVESPPDIVISPAVAALRIESDPPGAQVYWSDGSQEGESLDPILKPFCKTPCSLLPTALSDDGFIILTSRGHRSRFISLSSLAKAGAGTLWRLERWPPRRPSGKGSSPGSAPLKIPARRARGGPRP